MAAIYVSFGYWSHFFRQKAIRYVVKGFVGLEHLRVRGLVCDTACVSLAPCACELVSCLQCAHERRSIEKVIASGAEVHVKVTYYVSS